jgi:hypothetical protein
MNTENQQIESLKSGDVEISNPKNVSQDHFNSYLKIDRNKIEKLEKENRSVVEDDYEDEDVTVLVFWFGDPKLDVLTAEEWIGSVQRAKVQYEWNDLMTMHKVSISSMFYFQIFL